MVVIFHSMWVVHLRVKPLLETSSRLVRPHHLDPSDFIWFYFIFSPRLKLQLSLDACVREGVVKKLVDFHPAWQGFEPKCLWAESKALRPVSLSPLFYSFHRLNKTICGWNNYLNAGDLIPHRNRSHFQVDVRSWQLHFHCRWRERVEETKSLERWWQ